MVKTSTTNNQIIFLMKICFELIKYLYQILVFSNNKYVEKINSVESVVNTCMYDEYRKQIFKQKIENIELLFTSNRIGGKYAFSKYYYKRSLNESKTCTLRKQIFDLKVEILSYKLFALQTHRFDIEYFFQSDMSKQYLEMSDILTNCKTRRTILNMYPKLNYSCAKFLVDCYCLKKCDWDENIYDNFTENYKKPIHFMLGWGCYRFTDLTMRILNEHIDLETIDILGWKPIHLICCYGNEISMCGILDIYDKNQLDLTCSVMALGGSGAPIRWKPIHFIFRYGTQKTIDRIIKIYIEKGLDFGCETKDETTIFDLMKKNTKV